jgi:hypothetical protein
MKHNSSGVGILARTIQVDGSNGRPWISFLFVLRPHLSVMTTQSPFFPDERLQGPQSIALIRADQTKPSPKSGAVQLEWNKTGSLLLVRFGERAARRHSLFCSGFKLLMSSENVPTVVHIYSFPSPSDPFMPKLRSVLVHSRPVLHALWNPVRKGSLAICCGTRSLYTWSDEWLTDGGTGEEVEMAECIGVPASE